MSFRAGLTSPKALIAALVLGIGSGAAAAVWQGGQSSPPQLPAHLAVDPGNTPGFPKVKSGDFSLVNHHGQRRTSKNPSGEHQLIFFGYAKCKAICSVALPNIAEAVDVLSGMGAGITPILITVDPKRDTMAALAKAVPAIHPKMVGLTGDDASLEAAYKAFNIEKKFLFDHQEEGAIYSHSSFIYLLGPDGEFKTLFAPVTAPARIAEISAGYIARDRGRARAHKPAS